VDSIRSLPGVHQEYQDFIRTPDRLYQEFIESFNVNIKKGRNFGIGSNELICSILVGQSLGQRMGYSVHVGGKLSGEIELKMS
jgi:hypothetical protein